MGVLFGQSRHCAFWVQSHKISKPFIKVTHAQYKRFLASTRLSLFPTAEPRWKVNCILAKQSGRFCKGFDILYFLSARVPKHRQRRRIITSSRDDGVFFFFSQLEYFGTVTVSVVRQVEATDPQPIISAPLHVRWRAEIILVVPRVRPPCCFYAQQEYPFFK